MPDPRPQQIQRLRTTPLDVLVLGGGINGAGVIRDLALRARRAGQPLQVGLLEQKHFASGTSGKNSQLIHGGLRYLKYLQVHLVRESLHERSVLLRIAPRYVKPLAFLLPMYGIKSRLIYGTGLRLYDWLAGADGIAHHQMLHKRDVAQIEPELAADGLSAAAIFYDCGVASARFVVEKILDAMANGALAANYVRADAWERSADGLWRVQCTDTLAGEQFELRTRKLVDARGAWSDGDSLRLVRGSHIVIPRVSASDHAIAHFRGKIEGSLDPITGAEVLIDLLVRLNRYEDAIQASREFFPDANRPSANSPSLLQLCQMAGDHQKMRALAKEQGDLVGFAAGVIQSN